MDLDKIVFKIRNSQLNEDDVSKYGRILITEFAKYYHTEQLKLSVVSNNEVAVCDNCNTTKKNIITLYKKCYLDGMAV